MSSRDLMRNPAYAPILLAIEKKILECDRLAAARGLNLTDSNVRSLLIKASKAAARGEKPKSPAPGANAKDQFLAEALNSLMAVRDTIRESVTSDSTDLPTLEPLPVNDWIMSLDAIKASCAIRTSKEPGSRGYLEFLPGFIQEANERLASRN